MYKTCSCSIYEHVKMMPRNEINAKMIWYRQCENDMKSFHDCAWRARMNHWLEQCQNDMKSFHDCIWRAHMNHCYLTYHCYSKWYEIISWLCMTCRMNHWLRQCQNVHYGYTWRRDKRRRAGFPWVRTEKKYAPNNKRFN